MSTSDYRKAFKQLKNKPAKLAKFKKHNVPKKRTTGSALKKCKRCGQTHAHIARFGLGLCRHCFREIAKNIGFRKYN